MPANEGLGHAPMSISFPAFSLAAKGSQRKRVNVDVIAKNWLIVEINATDRFYQHVMRACMMPRSFEQRSSPSKKVKSMSRPRSMLIPGIILALMMGIVSATPAQTGSGIQSNSDWQFSDVGHRSVVSAPPVANPVMALEAKVNALQQEVASMKAIGNCVDNQCPTPGGLYVGGGVVFAKPHFKEAFQHSRTNLATGLQSLIPFGYDYEATPRVWAGFKNSSGMGFRVTYSSYHGNGQTQTNVADPLNIYGAHAVSIIFPANIFALVPGEVLTNSDRLSTQTFNYYGTYDTTVGSFEISGGVGLRNSRLDQELNSIVTNAAGAPIRQLSWRRSFVGLGPSVAIDIKRRIACSPFSIFTQAGGALLFGNKTLQRTVIGDQSPQPATPFLALDQADEVIGVGEMNFGVEWSRQMANGYKFNIRGLYEGQLWAEAGAPTLGFLGFEGFGVQAEIKR